MHTNCLTPKPLGVIFITPMQWLSLIRLRTAVERIQITSFKQSETDNRKLESGINNSL